MSDTRRIPVFPLPGVVLLPETRLPLHIFEPRYREMLADSLRTDKLIGIQPTRPGETDIHGRPAVYEIGCAGEVVEHEPLEEGRSNIVLLGAFRYRLEGEIPGRTYRIFDVTPLAVAPLPLPAGRSPGRRDLRRLLTRRVASLADAVGRPLARDLPSNLSDEGLVNEAASRLGLAPEESYQLLAMDRLEDRYTWVVAHVEATRRRIELLAPFRRGRGNPLYN